MNYDEGFWYIMPPMIAVPDVFDWTGLEEHRREVQDASRERGLYPPDDFLPALRRKWAERFEA